MPKGKRTKAEDDDDAAAYVPSDSEDEFSDSEKILLKKAKIMQNSDSDESEEEVYGLPSSDEDDKISDSDIDGQNDDDDLPDVKAWGQKRKNFYSTDYVDQDYAGFDEKDVDAAEQEEEEARAIQKRLIEQLDEGDFSLDLFTKTHSQNETDVTEEVIKADIDKLSKRQKLTLLKKEAPEYFGLVEDFRKNMTELQQRIQPIRQLIKSKNSTAPLVENYVQTKYHLTMNYCTNIVFYLLLKAKQIPIQSHPVVHRLYQYRQLLKELTSVDEVMASVLESVMEVIHDEDDVSSISGKHKKKRPSKKSKNRLLKFLSDIKEDEDANIVNQEPVEEMDVKQEAMVKSGHNSKESSDDEEPEEGKEQEEQKRGITYQIAKNKGLTPHRKKELRNPRVKHRNKFRKSKIRRKGQIREPRKEIQKYGGEISGIKIGVVKGIKLK